MKTVHQASFHRVTTVSSSDTRSPHGFHVISNEFVPFSSYFSVPKIQHRLTITIMSGKLAAHQHGKGRVRLGRVWREGNTHYMVEWTVFCMLESDMAHAFVDGSNADMTATDTQKNTV